MQITCVGKHTNAFAVFVGGVGNKCNRIMLSAHSHPVMTWSLAITKPDANYHYTEYYIFIKGHCCEMLRRAWAYFLQHRHNKNVAITKINSRLPAQSRV